MKYYQYAGQRISLGPLFMEENGILYHFDFESIEFNLIAEPGETLVEVDPWVYMINEKDPEYKRNLRAYLIKELFEKVLPT